MFDDLTTFAKDGNAGGTGTDGRGEAADEEACSNLIAVNSDFTAASSAIKLWFTLTSELMLASQDESINFID